jgi:uncharacterized protein (DUF2384 family)
MTEKRREMPLGAVSAEMRASRLGLFEGDEIDASRWLNQTCRALGHKTPADTIRESPEGEAIVRDVIIRREHGVHQ